MALDSSRKPDPSPTPKLWHRAGHALDRGDQWFSSSAGRVFGWVHRESNLATEQAVLAVAEAIGVRKQSLAIERVEHPTMGSGADDGVFRAPESSDLDLVWADEQRVEEQRAERIEKRLRGLEPLLQALGNVVEQHAPRSYASLAEDERFWMLVDVIVSLTKTEASVERGDGSVDPTSPQVETKGAT